MTSDRSCRSPSARSSVCRPARLARRQARVCSRSAIPASIVERLGGVFSSDLTPRTTIVVTGDEPRDVPPHVHRVLSEDDLCREAGLPDLETLRSRYYSAARSARHVPGAARRSPSLPREVGAGPADGRPLLVRRSARRESRRRPSSSAARRCSAVLRALSAERQGQLAFDFQPPRVRTRRPRASSRCRRAPPAEMTLFPPERDRSRSRRPTTRWPPSTSSRARSSTTARSAIWTRRPRAYRRAALFDPQLVPAIVNLANIHYERDELVEAEALYEKAIRLDAECFEAYFNLGNIHHDLGALRRGGRAPTATRWRSTRPTPRRTSIWR